ncbi:MAG: hypothetical protein AAAC47_20260 [Pararhizobium sp.]
MAASPLIILCEEYGKRTGNEKHQFAPGTMLFCARSPARYAGWVSNMPMALPKIVEALHGKRYGLVAITGD